MRWQYASVMFPPYLQSCRISVPCASAPDKQSYLPPDYAVNMPDPAVNVWVRRHRGGARVTPPCSCLPVRRRGYGDRGTVRGRDRSTVRGRDRSTVRGRDRSTVRERDRSTVRKRDRSMVRKRDRSTVRKRDHSMLITTRSFHTGSPPPPPLLLIG